MNEQKIDISGFKPIEECTNVITKIICSKGDWEFVRPMRNALKGEFTPDTYSWDPSIMHGRHCLRTGCKGRLLALEQTVK